MDNGVAWTNPVDYDELRSYYEQVDGVVITENTLTIPVDRGTVLIDFTDTGITATYTNN